MPRLNLSSPSLPPTPRLIPVCALSMHPLPPPPATWHTSQKLAIYTSPRTIYILAHRAITTDYTSSIVL